MASSDEEGAAIHPTEVALPEGLGDGLAAVTHGPNTYVIATPGIDTAAVPSPVVLLVDTSGSMSEVDPGLLKAAIKRTLRHFSTTQTPVSVLTFVVVGVCATSGCGCEGLQVLWVLLMGAVSRFSHNISFIKWRLGQRDVLMAGAGKANGRGRPDVVQMVGGGAMQPAVMPNDMALFQWVADRIVGNIGGATLATCALQVAASILGPMTGTGLRHGQGGHVLLMCDGGESYAGRLTPDTCLPVVIAAMEKVGAPVCVSALGLGSHADLEWLGTLSAATGGSLAAAHTEAGLGDAIAEVARTFTAKPRTMCVPGGDVRNVTLGAIVRVKKAGAARADFLDVRVGTKETVSAADVAGSGAGHVVALPVREVTPVELAHILARKLAKSVLRAGKMTMERHDVTARCIDAAIAEVSSHMQSKAGVANRSYALKVRVLVCLFFFVLLCRWCVLFFFPLAVSRRCCVVTHPPPSLVCYCATAACGAEVALGCPGAS